MRNTVITGGSRGMGRAMVDAFLNEGDRVFFTYIREGADAPVLSEHADAVSEGRLFAIKSDISSESDILSMRDFVYEKGGCCDVLINNAAIAEGGMVHERTAEDFDRMFGINVRGLFLACKHFLPGMLGRADGVIINFASLAGLNGSYSLALYSAAKAAVVSLTRSMGIDYASKGVRVNGICPSATATDMFYSGNDEEAVRAFARANPSGRIGTPEEIADVAVFLASDKARYMYGQMLSVDGGLSSWNGELNQGR